MTATYNEALLRSLIGTKVTFYQKTELLVEDIIHDHLYLVNEKDGKKIMLPCDQAEASYNAWIKLQAQIKDPAVKQFFKQYGIIFNGTKRDFDIKDGGFFEDSMRGSYILNRGVESYCHHSSYYNTEGESWNTEIKVGNGFNFFHTFNVNPANPIGFDMGQSIIQVKKGQQLCTDKELAEIKERNAEHYADIISGEYQKGHICLTNLKHEDIAIKCREALELIWSEDVLPYLGPQLQYTATETTTWDDTEQKYTTGQFYTPGNPFAFKYDSPIKEEGWDSAEMSFTRCNIFNKNRIKPTRTAETLKKGTPITLEAFKETIINPMFDEIVKIFATKTYEQKEKAFFKH